MHKAKAFQGRQVMALIAITTLALLLWTGMALGRDDDDDEDFNKNAYCSRTAEILHRACQRESREDRLGAKAVCLNISDRDERVACYDEVRETSQEAKEECDEKFEARLDVCKLVGEQRYDPDFSPERFVDPNDIGVSVRPNPYFPLVPGTRWVYEGGEERITVTVTNETKLIEGVTCRVVNDVVEEDGSLIEDTDDWYAQDLKGNVWYCGEEAKDYELFDGDEPAIAELVSIDGSFKAGRDGAKPGILVLAHPKVGDAYRQEVFWDEAEDVAKVISLTGAERVPAARCKRKCMVTHDFTPLEPGVVETKYYAPGVGTILEIDMEGNRTELVEFHTP